MTWSFPYSSLFLSGEIDESEMSFCFTGIFQIVAVNEISQTSSFWQFVVHSPPVILKNLNKKIESKEDDTVTFDIKVQGDPKPEVKW
jgi:Immunoglobulin I-set domain.